MTDEHWTSQGLAPRQDALRLNMQDRPQSEIEWFEVATRSENYSFAELKFVVDEATRAALAERRPINIEKPPQPKMSVTLIEIPQNSD